MRELAAYVEEISDEFQSTFTVMDQDTLANMLGMPGDFENLSKIIQRHIPGAEPIYTKTNTMDGDYDVYLVNLKEKVQ